MAGLRAVWILFRCVWAEEALLPLSDHCRGASADLRNVAKRLLAAGARAARGIFRNGLFLRIRGDCERTFPGRDSRRSDGIELQHRSGTLRGGAVCCGSAGAAIWDRPGIFPSGRSVLDGGAAGAGFAGDTRASIRLIAKTA